MGSDGAVSGWLVSGCMLSLGVLLEYVARVRLDLDILGFSISLTSLTAVIAFRALLSLPGSGRCAPRSPCGPEAVGLLEAGEYSICIGWPAIPMAHRPNLLGM